MAIISRNNDRKLQYGSNQMRYGVFYVAVTFLALLFLNIYCSNTSQDLFYRSKHTAMKDKVLLLSSAVGSQEVLNPSTAKRAIEELGSLQVNHIIITDDAGWIVYDSLNDAPTELCMFPEVVQALQGNDVITVHYHDGVIVSRAAAPILSRNTLSGCAYLLENDSRQGQVIQKLQYNLLTVSVILCLLVTLFTVISSGAFTRRLRKIMESMRIIREGNYTHKVDMGGHDELTFLGQEFNDLTDKLQRSEELRRQFVSDASHELKTPLASIKLLSDSILQNDMDLDTIREFVADIGDESDRLTRMSEKLLSLTRFHPDVGNNCEITYFAGTIDRVVRMLSTIADMADVTIHTQVETDSSILILEDDLYQILFNLVENGIKYNVPGGKLTLKLTREEDNAVLRFIDTGMGIPPESLDKIFDRFYRVDKARSRQTGGSGLGLAIVRDMTERNRGSIRVTSSTTEPCGTTFTLTFPVFDVEDTE